MNPSVSIVIVNYNGEAYISRAIESALAQRYDGRLDVIVVDNCSADASVQSLRKLRSISLIENAANVGFGGAANRAAMDSTADYLAFLNPDAIADADWLEQVVPWMNERGIQLASSVVRAGRSVWFAGGIFVQQFGAPLVKRHAVNRTDWLSGCALLALRKTFSTLGGFDDAFFLYCEDVDLVLRARKAGHRVAVFPGALVDHRFHGRSTNTLHEVKLTIAYASRGRLIAKHVNGVWQPLALAFTCLVSPLRNGVGLSHLPAIVQAVIRGFRAVKRANP
ncbi:MAG: glycosyltransferase family 2 protein [Candidatus Eremiobacteraeota bacterium]|nr:glycosyltransferase family 2 protein [Candidatus Eremiobacteraeota bacterium]MBC5825823.1 glycosyltransferase family 2 protein [Candidatus Eremiobacteraeota bacterium]